MGLARLAIKASQLADDAGKGASKVIDGVKAEAKATWAGLDDVEKMAVGVVGGAALYHDVEMIGDNIAGLAEPAFAEEAHEVQSEVQVGSGSVSGLDYNGDGTVDKEDFQGFVKDYTDANPYRVGKDRNKDGKIDENDLFVDPIRGGVAVSDTNGSVVYDSRTGEIVGDETYGKDNIFQHYDGTLGDAQNRAEELNQQYRDERMKAEQAEDVDARIDEAYERGKADGKEEMSGSKTEILEDEATVEQVSDLLKKIGNDPDYTQEDFVEDLKEVYESRESKPEAEASGSKLESLADDADKQTGGGHIHVENVGDTGVRGVPEWATDLPDGGQAVAEAMEMVSEMYEAVTGEKVNGFGLSTYEHPLSVDKSAGGPEL